jgi:hypothetical protein
MAMAEPMKALRVVFPESESWGRSDPNMFRLHTPYLDGLDVPDPGKLHWIFIFVNTCVWPQRPQAKTLPLINTDGMDFH